MIRDYSDHAANERTFLAWLRTGIAVIAFGFVIEKFNLFVLAMLNATQPGAAAHAELERFSGPFGFGAGHASSRWGSSSYWAPRHASSAPGACSTTRRCIRAASSPTSPSA